MSRHLSKLTRTRECYRGGNAKFADISCYLDLFSLAVNELGPKGGAAIAEALKINKYITHIK